MCNATTNTVLVFCFVCLLCEQYKYCFPTVVTSEVYLINTWICTDIEWSHKYRSKL